MIAIVAALPGELSAIEAAASAEGPLTSRRVAGRELHTGTLCGRSVVLALSGVGKVAAASTATLLVEQASAVVMVGTAGGIDAGVEPGDGSSLPNSSSTTSTRVRSGTAGWCPHSGSPAFPRTRPSPPRSRRPQRW